MIRRFALSIAAMDQPARSRFWLYRQLGLTILPGTHIEPRCYFTRDDLSTVELGEKVFINHDVYFDNSDRIHVGDQCCIAPFVKFVTTTHRIGDSSRRAGQGCLRKPIIIGSGCWIGTGCLILPGAHIGAGCVLAAGAIVPENKVLERDTLYAGVCRKIRDLSLSWN